MAQVLDPVLQRALARAFKDVRVSRNTKLFERSVRPLAAQRRQHSKRQSQPLGWERRSPIRRRGSKEGKRPVENKPKSLRQAFNPHPVVSQQLDKITELIEAARQQTSAEKAEDAARKREAQRTLLAEQAQAADRRPDAMPADFLKDDSVERVKYDSVRALGVGGNGKAFLIRQRLPAGTRGQGRLLACKIIRQGYPYKKTSDVKTASEQRRQKLRRGRLKEIRVLMSLPRNDRIIRFYDAIEVPTRGRCQIYMEYCNGGDLHDLIDFYRDRQRQVPESFAWHAFHQLAEGLAFLHHGYDHALGLDAPLPAEWLPVFHCDLKPENVLLRRTPRHDGYPDLVIADFGAAERKVGKDNRPRGTTCWQGPEIPEFSAQADVWGLGAVVHGLTHRGWPPVIWNPPPAFRAEPRFKGKESSEIHDAWFLQPEARVCHPMFGYSAGLESLMRQCFLPTKVRPSAWDIMVHVDNEVWNGASRRNRVPLIDGWWVGPNDDERQ